MPVGFSITRSEASWRSAVAGGANLLREALHRLRESLPDPISGSMEPAELAELVKGIRAIEQARGATKTIQPGEQEVRDVAQRGVDSRYRRRLKAIAAAECVGEAPRYWDSCTTNERGNKGQAAKHAISKDRLIAWDDLV